MFSQRNRSIGLFALVVLLSLSLFGFRAVPGSRTAPPGPPAAVEISIHVQPDGTWSGERRTAAALETAEAERAALSGQSLSDLARLVHDRQDGLEALDGPMMLELEGDVRAGQVFTLTLTGATATGYAWTMLADTDARLRQSGELERVALGPGLGVPERQVLRFEARAGGRARLRLAYQRPWELDAPLARRVAIQAPGVDLGTLSAALSQPLPDRTPPAESAPLGAAAGDVPAAEAESVAPPAVQALPSSFNWCTLGKCTPVRNQGPCGSCWAFATVGVLESALLITEAVSTDLSEQYLVSCNTDGWGCNGGWWAHDYHWWKKPPSESQAGAVLESAFPYVANQVPCSGPYAHPYRISYWAYVGPEEGVPDVAALKQAIYTYGPVAAAVCVGPAFQGYSSGVFTTNETCTYDVNHAVVLVGWDDAQQVWILRNSWGTGWGEGGYMRIRWGTSKVGFAASYIVYGYTFPYRTYVPLVLRRYPAYLTNGDFERGPDGSWGVHFDRYVDPTNTKRSLILSASNLLAGVGPHSGNYTAWLGGYAYENPVLWQRVTIPSTASTLEYWYWISSDDVCGYDYAYVRFGNTTLRTYNLCQSTNTGGWVYHTINISAYRGQTVQLRFKVTTDGSLNSNFFLDDVGIPLVGVGAPPAEGAYEPASPTGDWTRQK